MEENKVKEIGIFTKYRLIITVKCAAATTHEEIIQIVRVKKEGEKEMVCDSIAVTTLEKVVDMPIITSRSEDGPLINSIKRLTEKI